LIEQPKSGQVSASKCSIDQLSAEKLLGSIIFLQGAWGGSLLLRALMHDDGDGRHDGRGCDRG